MKTRIFKSRTRSRRLLDAFDELDRLVHGRTYRFFHPRRSRLVRNVLRHPRALLAVGLGVAGLIATFTRFGREGSKHAHRSRA